MADHLFLVLFQIFSIILLKPVCTHYCLTGQAQAALSQSSPLFRILPSTRFSLLSERGTKSSHFLFSPQGSYTKGIDPTYACKLFVPVPKTTDDIKRIRVKNQKWKLRTKVGSDGTGQITVKIISYWPMKAEVQAQSLHRV